MDLFNVHTCFQSNPPDVNKKIAQKLSIGFAVMIVNLKGDKNIGTIIRTSAIFGASKVYVIGRRYFDKRTLVGANNYIDIEKIMDFPDELQTILHGYSPICVEQGGISLEDMNWGSYLPGELLPPPCFILGAEDTGLSREFIDKCKKLPGFKCVSIPQIGILRSLNVSVAHGIIINDYVSYYRQHIKNKNTIE